MMRCCLMVVRGLLNFRVRHHMLESGPFAATGRRRRPVAVCRLLEHPVQVQGYCSCVDERTVADKQARLTRSAGGVQDVTTQGDAVHTVGGGRDY